MFFENIEKKSEFIGIRSRNIRKDKRETIWHRCDRVSNRNR